MTDLPEVPKFRPGSLVTVAFLKARLDEGGDHLGLFMPLICDILPNLPPPSFTTSDVQEAVAAAHGVSIPQQTVATLLSRAKSKGLILRDSGRYRRNPNVEWKSSNVASAKSQIEESQQRLGEALRDHAKRRGLNVESANDALDLLFRFLEREQVGILLQNMPSHAVVSSDSQPERMAVAEFIQDIVVADPALSSVLRRVLEGLVLYHAAFLPDLNSANRRFKDMRVFFDSNLVRQALGYEGLAMQTLMCETMEVLKGSGVQCCVFDKTVYELRRLLSMYETKIATDQGRRSLRPVPMTRHFLTKRYTPGDIREMSALLEGEVKSAGFIIERVPSRVSTFTAGEHELAARLVNPATKDETEPRIVHDIDCVAGVLTLRKGHRSTTLEDARVVFATGSPLVTLNVRLWWVEDERESSIEPVIHIRALANLAWLKKPSLCNDFKLRELVALCSAALRPQKATWDRFLRHLDELQKSNRMNSDGVTAIMVSAMSDQLLREAESGADDPNDIDAVTLDEIIDRVKTTYTGEVQHHVQEISLDYEDRLLKMEQRERTANERAASAEHVVTEVARRRQIAIEGRAQRWARRITVGSQWLICLFLCSGAISLIIGHPFHSGVIGWAIGIGVAFFVSLELAGILRHVCVFRAECEMRLSRWFRNRLLMKDDLIQLASRRTVNSPVEPPAIKPLP